MYNKFDEIITKCADTTEEAAEAWYDEKFKDIAYDLLQKFTDEDWRQLFQKLPHKSSIWKDRFASLLDNREDYNQLKAVMYLVDEYYGDISDYTEYYLQYCSPSILKLNIIMKEEINKYLPDRLADFDIKKFIDKYKKEPQKPTQDIQIYANTIDEEALNQIKRLINQEPFKNSKIRIMPDVHAGKNCVIGFTGDLGDKAIPSIVGGDIGCGMLCSNLGAIDIDYEKLDDFIKNNIPSGKNINDKKVADFDLTRLYCYKNLKNVDLIERAIGTLGDGNHFIEIDESNHHKKFLVIHTGSRNLGSQVAKYYQDLADKICNYKILEYKEERHNLIEALKREGKEKDIESALAKLAEDYQKKPNEIPYDLTYLEGEQREAYLHDMKICQEYAQLNRYVIARRIANYMGWNLVNSFESVHNYISSEDNIVRKGAISAKEGEKVIIPINMRDGCIIGIGKGNADWNWSAPHGAGRVMSRTKAQEQVNLEDYKQTMSNVYTTSVNETTKDESPFAYKSLDNILSRITPTVEVVDIIKSVYNYKSSGTQLLDINNEEQSNSKVR